MRTIVFDTETQFLADEVPGGWSNVPEMQLALGVTWVEYGGFTVWGSNARQFGKATPHNLVDYLADFDRIIGWNLNFDYPVLWWYVRDVFDRLTPKTLDLCASIKAAEGVKFTRPLDDVARATLGRGKTGDGADAPALYRDGKLEELQAYCEADVALTRDLYLYGVQHGHVLVPPAPWRPNDQPGKVAVNWGQAVTA